MHKARPERFRISLRDETGGTPLPLPSRRMWPIGIFFGVAFLIFAGIAWSQIDSMRGHQVRSVFDLVFILFQGFWVVGWSVGVFILGALSVLLLFYSESARLHGDRLIYTPSLGPLRLSTEYDLAKIRNLRRGPLHQPRCLLFDQLPAPARVPRHGPEDTDGRALQADHRVHLTIILGGFLTMLLRTPAAALLLLIALKTATDLYAHRKEHAR